MTVDWTRWATDRDKLLAQYRAIVADEIARAKFNQWRRLDLAIRYPHTWRQHAQVQAS